MTESNSPIRIWDYCVERFTSIHNLTSRNMFKLQGLIPHTALIGEYSGISNLCQFCWFEWIYYRDDKKNFPEHKERLGKSLGSRKGVGNEMCQWVLQPSGEVIERRTVIPLTVTEINNKVESEKQKLFLRILHKNIGISHTPAGKETPSNRKANVEPYEDDEDSSDSNPDLEVTIDNNKEFNQKFYHDRLTHSEVTLQRDTLKQRGKVKGTTVSPDGSIIGTRDDNPILNTLTHDIEF